MTFRSLRLPLVALFLSLAGCGATSPDGPAVGSSAPAAPGPRALVVQDGGPAIVLAHGLDAAITRGAITLLAPEWPAVVRRDLPTDGLTPDEQQWQGRTVRLHGELGPVCEGIVEGLEARGRVNLMDDGQDAGDDDGEVTTSGTPARERDWNALAQHAWDAAPEQGSLDLVGRIQVTRGDCTGAIWAQLADEAPPVSGAAEPAGPELTAQVLAAVRASDAYRETQNDYETFRTGTDLPDASELPGSWEEYLPLETTVQLLAHPGGETYVVSVVQAGEHCGSFGGELTQLWQLRDGALEQIPASLSSGGLPLGTVDLDGDGHVELLVPHGYLRWTDGSFEEVETTSVPDNAGCSC